MKEEISNIGYVILGLLSWRGLTGYDLKGMFIGSVALHWSGNNNQIYKTLVGLHRAGLVSVEVQTKVSGPLRKVYSITAEGRAALKAWASATPEPPQPRNPLLMQLAWADQLSSAALSKMLAEYEEDVRAQLAMLQKQLTLKQTEPTYIDIAQARTGREAFLWRMIMQNWISFYESELKWLSDLKKGLAKFKP